MVRIRRRGTADSAAAPVRWTGSAYAIRRLPRHEPGPAYGDLEVPTDESFVATKDSSARIEANDRLATETAVGRRPARPSATVTFRFPPIAFSGSTFLWSRLGRGVPMSLEIVAIVIADDQRGQVAQDR